MKNGKTTLYATLKREILTLELAPDQDIDEVRLGERFGISRTPVRDVLRQLAGEGYLEVRENRGARVIPMNHATMRDFFLVAPMVYEAVGRLAVRNARPAQLADLERCQDRFRDAIRKSEPDAMVIDNTRFHAIVGEMSQSTFLAPSLGKLLIDHARIGHTFFRPASGEMEDNLERSCRHHDEMIQAIAGGDEASMVRLVRDHWELSRGNMELFIAPPPLPAMIAPAPERRPATKKAKAG